MSFHSLDLTVQRYQDIEYAQDCDYRRQTLHSATWRASELTRRLSRWQVTDDGNLTPTPKRPRLPKIIAVLIVAAILWWLLF